MNEAVSAVVTMSEEQLKAFLEAVKAGAGLREKLQGAADLDAALAIAQEAGFDVSKADWLRYQEKTTLAVSGLSDDELENVAGGGCTARFPRCETQYGGTDM